MKYRNWSTEEATPLKGRFSETLGWIAQKSLKTAHPRNIFPQRNQAKFPYSTQ